MKKINKNSIRSLMFVLSLALGLVGPVFVFAAGPSSVDLGSANNFVILAKTGISTTGTTSVIGDIGASPVTATSITGFALILPTASAFATSAIVTGKVYAPDYASPTPVKMTTAVSDMENAYTNGMGRTNPTATELGAGNLGGLTIAPGLYKWGTGVTIPTDVTLAGGANDVWIFQVAQNLDLSSGAKIILSGGAQAQNIFWIVAGQTTLGTTAVFNGNILDQTAIILNTGATLHGRALAQTAVTLDANSVIIPAGGNTVVTPDPTPTPPPASNSSGGNSNSSNSNSNSQSQNIIHSNVVVPAHNLFGKAVSTMAGSLKAGSMGEAVKTLQQFLIQEDASNEALKNYGLDGNFGPVTKAALMKWQASHNLDADGIFGLKTKAKIKDLAL